MNWLKKLLEFINIIHAKQQSVIQEKEGIVKIGKREEDRTIKWQKSPNYGVRLSRKITAIILHHTANWNLENAVDWMCDPDSQVSAHYTIGLDGTIVQSVHDKHVAWHAGHSELNGQKYVNNFSIGIELVGNTCLKPLTEPQWDSLLWLVKKLMKKYNVPPHQIVDHRKISPGRKVDLDPANFNWLRFYREIGAMD